MPPRNYNAAVRIDSRLLELRQQRDSVVLMSVRYELPGDLVLNAQVYTCVSLYLELCWKVWPTVTLDINTVPYFRVLQTSDNVFH